MSIYSRYRPGQIIRNIATGKPLLVVHSFNVAVLVVDLEDGHQPAEPRILLERDYPYWKDEKDMESKINISDSILDPKVEWKPINNATI